MFNHPGFIVTTQDINSGSQNMDINYQQFGKITQQANTSRELQFGLRVQNFLII